MKTSPEQPGHNVPDALSRMKRVDGVSGLVDTEAFEEPANRPYFVEEREKRDKMNPLGFTEEINAYLREVYSYRDFTILRKLFKDNIIDLADGVKTFTGTYDYGHFKEYAKSVGESIATLVTSLKENDFLTEERAAGILASRSERSHKGSERIYQEIMLPRTLGELLNGDSSTGETIGGRGFEENIGWFSPITLSDGSVTTPIEIRLCQIYREYGFVRDDNGTLGYYHDSEWYKFTLSSFIKNFGKTAEGTYKTSAHVVVLGLRNCLGKLFEMDDFKLLFNAEHVPMILLRKLGNGGDLPLFNGQSFKYYMGRKNSVLDNGPLTEDCRCAVLDAETGAFFRERKGSLEITSTFPLGTKADREAARIQTAKDLGKDPAELSDLEVTNSPYVRIKPVGSPYDVTDLVSPYDNEPPKEYARRVQRHANVEGTIDLINRFCLLADLNHLEISWANKLRLSEIIPELSEERLVKYARTYGINGVKLLLLAETDKQWPERILTMSETVEKDTEQEQFKHAVDTFGRLVTDEKEFSDILQSVMKTPELKSTVASLRKETLSTIQSGFTRSIADPSSLVQAAQTAESGMLGKLITIRALISEGNISKLNELQEGELEIRHGNSLEAADVSSMRQIYSQNQAEVVAHDDIITHFDERVKNPDAWFYIFKWQGKIQSFVAFEPKKGDDGKIIEGTLEVTSFNVDPSARGYRIGEAMLHETIDREAKGAILVAESYADKDICGKYIETGWVAESTFTDEKEGKVNRLLNIKRDDTHNPVYWGKGEHVTREQIVRRENIPASAVVVSAVRQEDLPFEEQFAQGKVLTRMFKEPSPGRMYFAVFEPYKRKQNAIRNPGERDQEAEPAREGA